MAAKFYALLTSQGAARLANAAALGTKVNITHMAVGDGGGSVPVPDPAQTALIGEQRRALINSLNIDKDNSSQIVVEQVIPEDEGGFWIREIGLFDSEGILLAVANCPDTYKPKLQEGSGRTQTVRMIIIVSSTTAITLKIDPSVVLATRKYVEENVLTVREHTDELMRTHVAADNPHPQYGSAAFLQITSEIANGGPARDVMFLPRDKLPKIRGGNNDVDVTPYLLDMVQCGSMEFKMQNGIFNISQDITTPDGSAFRGMSSGLYTAIGQGILEQNAGRLTLIQTMHSGEKSRGLIIGKHGVVEDLFARPERYDLIDFQDASYGAKAIAAGKSNPANLNAQYGIHLLSGAKAVSVTALGFAKDNMLMGITSKVITCHSFLAGGWGYSTMNDDMTGNASDGSMIDCVGMFCGAGGAWTAGNFWKNIGGRFEWNAGYGIRLGGEGQLIGATLDRNALAGVHINHGAWGVVVSSNYFARNGCGGDGTTGRWAVSKPGHHSYVEVPHNMSAHLQIDYQHAGVISSNRFRHGLDDNGGGADGPAYNYTSASDSGASPKSGMTIIANEGETNSSVLGYNTNYKGASGRQVGGSDTDLSAMLRGGITSFKNGVSAPAVISGKGTLAAVASRTIPVPYRYQGPVMLSAGKGGLNPALTVLWLSCDPSGTRRAIQKEIKVAGEDSAGVGYITSSSYTAGTDGETDILSVVFNTPVFNNYAVGHGGMS